MSKFDRKITRTFKAPNLTADITVNSHGGWRAVVHFADQSRMPREISGTEVQVCNELQRLAGGKGEFRRTIEITDRSKMAGPTVEQAKEQMIAANEGRRYERRPESVAPASAPSPYTPQEQKEIDDGIMAKFLQEHVGILYGIQKNVDLLHRYLKDTNLPLTTTNLEKAFQYLDSQNMLYPQTQKRGWLIREYRTPAETEKRLQQNAAAERNAEIERAKAMPLEQLAKEVPAGYKQLVTPGVSVAEKRQS